MSVSQPTRVALIGAGRIGSSHAVLLAHHIHTAELVLVADPTPKGEALAEKLGIEAGDSAEAAFKRADIDAVVITTPARTHTDLVVAATAAGKHVFVEKPMAVTLEEADRAIAAAEDAHVILQVGFNRRFASGFAAARGRIDAGGIGTPQLLRSVTRGPGPFGADPTKIPQWTIFLETLIHDFDALGYLNPGATPVKVTAHANALVVPEAKADGFLDTAVVTVEFDNGAIGTAEANFSALYGYDVRGEAFGSQGMVNAGDIRTSNMTFYCADGITIDTARRDTDLLRDAHLAELRAFVDSVREAKATGRTSSVNHNNVAIPRGEDARQALAIALAAIESVQTGTTVHLQNN